MQRLLLLISLLSVTAFAGEAPPDITAELARAQAAWQEADKLGLQARAAEAKDKSFIDLLEKQDAAYARAVEAFKAALEKDPDNPVALADFGRFWLLRHDFARARLRFEAACNSPRAKAEFSPAELANNFRRLAGLLERAGEFNPALDYYQRALKLNPKDARNRISLAVALSASGRSHETIKLLQAWLETTGAAADEQGVPKVPAHLALARFTLAVAQEDCGYMTEALSNYRKARQHADAAGKDDSAKVGDYADFGIARLEDHFDALNVQAQERSKENEARKAKNLPLLAEIQEDLARATYLCDQAVDLKERALADTGFLRALQRSRSGLADDSSELAKEPAYDSLTAAMNLLNEAVVKAPRMARAHFELAACHVLVGRYSTARTLLNAASIYSPYNLAVLNLKAETLLELGQWEEAAAVYTALLALEPDSGPANFGLARAYAALQRDLRECQTALHALERALQLGLRDPRIFSTRRLVCKDGLEFSRFRKDGDAYIVSDGAAPQRIAAAEVAEVRNVPGMHEQLEKVIERFERGETPAAIPTIKGVQKGPKREGDPFGQKGTIFDR